MLSLDELRACGLTSNAVKRRARSGRLHRLHRTVYAVGHPAVTKEGRWLAAVKACGAGAVLSHYSAAAYWGFVEWDDRDPEVTVTSLSAPRHAGIRVHQSFRLERRDWMVRDQIPVTSPARTLVDLASLLEPRPLRRAVREALGQRRVSIRRLAAALAKAGPRRGSRKLARIIADGPVRTKSVLEDIVWDLIIAAGFEPPEVNRPIVVAGRRVVPDFHWPERGIIVEADGSRWHDHKLAREEDAERQALLEAHGEHVIRVTWHQAVMEPAQTRARIAAAGAPLRRAAA